jgi:hypothetical protein
VQNIPTDFKEAVRAPRERYEYIAPIWLQAEIEITDNDVADNDVFLFMERVNMSSMLWIDGVQVGSEIVELSVPHIYNLSSRSYHIISGKHLLTLRIDNRDKLCIGDMASGYSVDTQGYWNGIIGRIELQLKPHIHIDDVQIYPTTDYIDVHVVTRANLYVPLNTKIANIKLTVITPEGKRLKSQTTQVELFTSRQRNRFRYNLHEMGEGNIRRWNEFDHELYTLEVQLDTENGEHKVELNFGMRQVCVKNKQFYIDERPFSLRGTINCAQYPLTGYPPMDVETWIKHMSNIKEFGLNHIRFHAWCPPEAAFVAADRLGLYLLVEMPLWLNRDVVDYEFGDEDVHETYYMREARQIRKAYGNHPSFMMFSNGNENMGDFALLEDCIEQIKARDKRCLYTLTSNFDHPVHPCEDYLSAFEMGHTAARIQFLHDKVAQDTSLTYDEVVDKISVPVVSFEVGQYCVYPDVDITKQYTGNMNPVNFAAIKKRMEEKGVYSRLNDYIKASGDLAAKLYKEDIEAVLRTQNFGGIELLSISDYTGQSTATVGMLDVFYNDKGVVDKKWWRGFCNEVVPLFSAKRIFHTNENLKGSFTLYDYGRQKIDNPEFKVCIYDGDAVIYEDIVKDKLDYPLDSIKEPKLLKVSAQVEGNGKVYENSWRVFVYQKTQKLLSQDIEIISDMEQFRQALKSGKKITATVEVVSKYLGRDTKKTNFIPVFWSPVHFESSDFCGAIVDEKHEVLKDFPTEHYIDYQWKDLLENGIGMDIKGLNVHPIIEMVPNYVDNSEVSPLFEMEIDGVKVLACGFKL